MDLKEEARLEGILEEKIETIQRALDMGIEVEQIARICRTTVEFVEQIKNNKIPCTLKVPICAFRRLVVAR